MREQIHSAPLCVVMPAHDEGRVIEDTLEVLLRDARSGEFDVIVVANGCTDDTAERARRASPAVRTIELDEASKTAALNAGIAAAHGASVLFLDADIRLPTAAARALCAAARAPGVDAAIGRMETDLQGASHAVRAFYRVWALQPYFDGGKFAAAFALSRDALDRLGSLPPVTADDEYVARRMRTVRSVDAPFLVRPPRTLMALVAVRTRARRGTRDLAGARGRTTQLRTLATFAGRLLRQPTCWSALPLYLGIVLTSRLRALRAGAVRWERDETSRSGAHAG